MRKETRDQNSVWSEIEKCGCSGLAKQENLNSIVSQEQHSATQRSWQLLFYTYVNEIPQYSIQFSCVSVSFWLVLENVYEDRLHRLMFTWKNVICEEKVLRHPGDKAKCKVKRGCG